MGNAIFKLSLFNRPTSQFISTPENDARLPKLSASHLIRTAF